jgi:alpha-galactosidase
MNRAHVALICIACLTFMSRDGAAEPSLARTPPMGWNSWNAFHTDVSDAIVRAQVDAMIRSGMKDVGYLYINIDDGWQGDRDRDGNLRPNRKFPDMKALGDYIHSRGLRLGIYSTPGRKTCGGYEGTFGHEEQDARTFAAWGVDYLKYDWCLSSEVYAEGEHIEAFQKMAAALKRTGRPIVYSVSHHLPRPWLWAPGVGANLWRTMCDLSATWGSISLHGFTQNGLERFAGPGHWNDPDMLQVGNDKLTENESRSHMSLWSILAAPLLAGKDLTKMDAKIHDILTNPEIIAVDQDLLGAQGRRVAQEGPLEVWVKPLSDGSKAVGLFNRSDAQGFTAVRGVDELPCGRCAEVAGLTTPTLVPITVYFRDIGVSETATVRDLWARKNLGTFHSSYTTQVPRHGAAMLRIQ